MINLDFIKQFYSPVEQNFTKAIIREFLQYQILDIIYSTKFGKNIYFLWWTAIRIIYNSGRFSEDLDFDNFWLDEKDFKKLTWEIKKWLELAWYEVEIKNIFKWARHCNIKLPKILFETWLSAYQEEKILIQIDTVKQEFLYTPDKKIIDKFWIFNFVLTAPIDILASKKIHALLWRKRLKWRDFYDILFLLDFTKPNYKYLENKIEIKNKEELISKIKSFCKNLDFKNIAKDVEPFLINKKETLKIERFLDLFLLKINNNFNPNNLGFYFKKF